MSIKKDIYYSVVGDFARFQLALATLADTPLPTLQTALPSADFAANYAKIELIAPLPLVREIQKVSQEIRETFMPLMLERARLKLKADSLNEAGMMLHEAVIAWDAHNRLHSEFRVRCMEGSLRIRRLLAPAVREIRRELDVSVDMKTFEVLLQTDIDHADGAFRRFQAAPLDSTLSS